MNIVKMTGRRVLSLATALLMAGAGLMAAAAGAQERLNRVESPIGEESAVQAATEARPLRVRNILRSIHGFDRAALEGASAGLPGILMEMVDDGNESALVHRQAILALGLYPEDGVLQFIEERVEIAPPHLRRTYLSALARFAAMAPHRVTAAMDFALADPDLSVRYAALNLSQSLTAQPGATAALRSRLETEPDAGLRVKIEQQLGLR